MDRRGFMAGALGTIGGAVVPDLMAPMPMFLTPHGRRKPAKADTLLWAGDFEASSLLPTFGRIELDGTSNPVRVNSPVLQGSWAGQFTAPANAVRSELIPMEDLTDGQIRYFGFSVYLDPTYTFEAATWGRVVAQWRYNGTDSSPPFALYLMEGAFWKIHSDPSGSDISDDPSTAYTTSLSSASNDKGRWVRWVFGVYFKAAAGTTKAGWLEVWKDGVQVLSRTAAKTLYMKTDGVTPWQSSLKFGIYRSNLISTQDIVTFDDWRMGTNYDAVA